MNISVLTDQPMGLSFDSRIVGAWLLKVNVVISALSN